MYERLVQMTRQQEWFSEKDDAAGNPAHPLELKILGVLRVLGRASFFDDVYELNAISGEVSGGFFICCRPLHSPTFLI